MRAERHELVEDPDAFEARDDMHPDFGDPSNRLNVLEPTEAEAAREEAGDLSSMTVDQLRALAEQLGVELEAGMRKAEIVDALEEAGA